MVAPAESSQARPHVGRDPRSPSHLLRWTSASDARVGAPTVVHGDQLDELVESSGRHIGLGDWFRSAGFGADGDEVVAAVFPNHRSGTEGPLDLVDLTRSAIDLDIEAQDRRAFTGDTMPTSLRALRRWAIEQLEGRGCAVDDVVLVLSELATNVERHAESWLTVDLVETQGAVLVAVTDPTVDRLPTPRTAAPDELTGRGLLVVASLSLAWGVVLRPASKTVWAALPCPPVG